MKWTEQQKEAIEAGGSDILVSAAAGSGKTAVMTERIRRLVVDREIGLGRMLVVTFTNAAASEMKEKILRALRDEEAKLAGAGSPAEKERKKFVRDQIRNASAAEICTFHRFSIDVIRNNFYLTDVDPHFRVCEENYGTILRNRCLDDLFEEKFESADGDFRKFIDAYGSLKGEQGARDMILEVYNFIMNMADPFGWLHEHVEWLNCSDEEFTELPAYKAYRKSIKKDVEIALKISEKIAAEAAAVPYLNIQIKGKESIGEKLAADRDALSALYRSIDETADEELSSALAIKWKTMRANSKTDEKAAWEEVKEDINSQRDVMKDIMKKAAERVPALSAAESAGRARAQYPYAVILADLVKEFYDRFTAAKKEKNLLDFDDIEHEALRILSDPEHPEAALGYQNRFDAIFIDEYQDSSRVQEAIIDRVSGGNVYMVGDVKQSIYKFRQADPDIFIRKYNGFAEGALDGRRVDLSRNFRSKPGVINAVNGVFRNIMTREQSGIAYDKAAELTAGTPYKTGPLVYRSSLQLADTQTDRTEEGTEIIDREVAELSKAEFEGRLIARLVSERVGKSIYDDKLGRERTVGYGDIAVLVRSGTHMNVYSHVMSERGIPVFAQGGAGFYQAPEVEVMLDLLKLISNNRRDRELISVLYSSMKGFGFSVDDLASIRLFDREGSYSDAFFGLARSGEESDLAVSCALAADRLAAWRVDSRYMPLTDFIWKLMVDTGYYAFVSALPGGGRRAANLRLFVNLAGEFTSFQGEGLFSFLRYMEQLEKNGSRAQASNEGDTSGMVQIMTIHRSKGLEFPIVIIPNIDARINHGSDTAGIQMHKNLGIALEYRDSEKHIKYRDLIYRSIKQLKIEEDIEEEKRILYVGMTRARDELILTASGRKMEERCRKAEESSGDRIQSPDSRLDWVLMNAGEADIDVKVHTVDELTGEMKADEAAAGRAREEIEKGFPSFTDKEGISSEIQRRFSYNYPYARDVVSKSKYSVTELNRVLLGRDLEAVQYVQASETDSDYAEENDPSAEKYSEEAAGADGELTEETADMPADYAVPRFIRGEDEVTPAVRGTASHKVLELIDYTEDTDEEKVRNFCDSLVSRGLLSEREAESVPAGKLAAFFASDLGLRACRADARRNEWAFTIRKNTAELASEAVSREIGSYFRSSLPESILVQGVIDCCFRDAEGIVVIDFKTDRVRPSDWRNGFARFVEQYRRQVGLYREVVEKEYGESVQKSYLYMLDAGRAVEIG